MIFKGIDNIALIARLTIKLAAKQTATKQKQSQLSSNSTNKQAKKN